jgi:NAD(P)-dependent dehydrogenase (short-subunit alcohol dehydrogenase family)
MSELRFDGRVALVTGGGRGLGRAYTHLLAARGASVVVNDVGASPSGDGSDSGVAAAVVAEIAAVGGSAIASTESVTDADGVEAMVERAVRAFGRIDIVVSNAGNVVQSRFPETEPADLDHHLDIHVAGAFNVCRAVWPQMEANGHGRIVITISSAVFGAPWILPYSTAKAGLIGLGRSLAAAGAENGIAVNMVAPRAATRLTPGAMPKPADLGTPEEVAPAVAFLCHDSCPVTGQMYRIGSGRMSRIFFGETESVAATSIEEVPAAIERVRSSSSFSEAGALS